MDEEIERLVIGVRADTAGFARDLEAMRAQLEGPFGDGVARAGRGLEAVLARAVRTGRLGFEDLKRVALQVLGEIAASAVTSGIGAILAGIGAGGGGTGRGGIAGGLLGGLTGGLIGGLPGRATGGPVSPGQAYLVGERGPELFVPTMSGRIAPGAAPGRDVRIAITVNAPGGTDQAQALARSSRQIAREVRRALG
ncbi:tail tape measure protein [Sphingomonas changnyeongensis]|uniref:Tail tape measure protein n=1 Tax=Sphingomonas changnyeongensis TaxID=2698679 RepID=A0A7Z2NVN8_9SPHN|nr:tail tape measure protein [Sphingomonas changnyeongensis]QHL90663.1 tail tape measure protein [Sphingomonas changnyeongensis]